MRHGIWRFLNSRVGAVLTLCVVAIASVLSDAEAS